MSSLSQINSRILKTADVRHHVIFEDSMNVREVLVALQTRFKKTEHGKEQEVRDKWNKLMVCIIVRFKIFHSWATKFLEKKFISISLIEFPSFTCSPYVHTLPDRKCLLHCRISSPGSIMTPSKRQQFRKEWRWSIGLTAAKRRIN